MNSKTEILKFRVTPKEKEIINNKALSCNKTVSMYLRDCTLEKEIKIVVDSYLVNAYSSSSIIHRICRFNVNEL